MSMVRLLTLLGGAALMLTCTACGPDDTSCDLGLGRYKVQYDYVDSTCPLMMPPDVNICSTSRSENSTGSHGSAVVTVIDPTGCTVSFDQTQFKSQLRSWWLHGDLDVIADDELHGRVSYQEFDANEAVSCTGTYDAHFMKIEDNPVECMAGF